MKWFTNHKGNRWGQFLDRKQFDFKNVNPKKYNNKNVLLSSVNDPYIPLELKYKNTRKILETLISTKAKISILTKSKFIIRDKDLFEKLLNIKVGISINIFDKNFAKITIIILIFYVFSIICYLYKELMSYHL